MKKITTLIKFILVLSSVILFGATTALAQEQPVKERVELLQTGTLQLQNGKATVTLNQNVQELMTNKRTEPTYYIVFTPNGEYAPLAISEKGDKSFSVAAPSGSTDIMVDYILYCKQTFK